MTVKMEKEVEEGEKERRRVVEELIEKLETGSEEEKRTAVEDVRLLAKNDSMNRRYIADANGIELLLPLLRSEDDSVQESAITALLNLSIQPDNRVRITQTYGALDGIVEVLSHGRTEEVKENAAATLFSLLIEEDYREEVGRLSGAIPALLKLLREATTPRGKKDALKGLFHLSLHDANKPRVVAAGGVPLLASFLSQKHGNLMEDALSVLAIIALCDEGVAAMMQATILPMLVQILSKGVARARENSVAVMLAMCQTGGDPVLDKFVHFNCQIVATLCTLLVVGSDRAKRKAQALMRLLIVSDSSMSTDSSTHSSQSDFF